MSEPVERPTYGNIHTPNTNYLGGVGKKTFYLLVVAIASGLLMLMLGIWILGIVILTVVAIGWALMRMRFNNRSGFELLSIGWRSGTEHRTGANILRAGALSNQAGGRTRLPGIAAATEMWWGIDTLGRRFAMIYMPSTAQYTVVLRCTAPGFAGAEQDRINLDVASWGEFINVNGQAGDVAGIATVTETLPETGARAAANIAEMCAPGGSPLAQQAVRETQTAADSDGMQIYTRMAITWKAKTSQQKKNPMIMIGDLAERIPTICENLSHLRVVAVPMSDHLLAATVRRSYDPRPSVEAAVERILRTDEPVVAWSDAGPLTTEGTKASYFHDGAVSRTWEMSVAPRGALHEGILAVLLAPNPRVPRKRVTLIHRPLSPADAATAVEQGFVNAVNESGTQKGVSTARGELALRAARQTRDEEAAGSGVTDFALLVTVTADTEAELDRIAEDVVEIGVQARLGLRPCWRFQPAAFLASLGVGVLLPDHATTPKSLQA
ncbi:SCO6880 family protein [Rhodococcus rhodnii]|uniref:SCO6880 family protein n=1 Tax=Rhodococcus rhodnii TaxID=38312 RepID=UPI00093303CF|nr:SCO6880 family protein [Rhodococcus rhodnii]